MVVVLLSGCTAGSTQVDGTSPSPYSSGTPGPTAPSATPALRGAVGGRVTRLVDGDTLWVSGVKIRLIGMDTPETRKPNTPVQCYGEQSSARMAALLPVGTAVQLVYDRARLDRYGRTLAYVYRAADHLFVNAELVREGYARVLTVPPDVAHRSEFEALERDARAARRGRWSACAAQS